MLPRIQQKHSVAIPKIVGGRIAPTSRFAQNSVPTQVLVTTFSREVDCYGDLANLVLFNPPLISLICGNVQSQQGRLAIPQRRATLRAPDHPLPIKRAKPIVQPLHVEILLIKKLAHLIRRSIQVRPRKQATSEINPLKERFDARGP